MEDKIAVYNILVSKDLKEHIENGSCNCNPRIKILEDIVLIIHNSYDFREVIE